VPSSWIPSANSGWLLTSHTLHLLYDGPYSQYSGGKPQTFRHTEKQYIIPPQYRTFNGYCAFSSMATRAEQEIYKNISTSTVSDVYWVNIPQIVQPPPLRCIGDKGLKEINCDKEEFIYHCVCWF
jgi:hypothetical protein